MARCEWKFLFSLVCVESKLLCERTERRETEKREERDGEMGGRDGEIDGDGVRTLKRKKDFHSGFSSCAWIQ